MDSSILIYALPSISAISIKLLMIWYGWRSIRAANLWFWLFLGGLFGVNLCELLLFGYAKSETPSEALPILSLYYIFAVLSCCAYLAVSLEVSGFFSKALQWVIVSAMLVGFVILIVPGAALSGAESIGYSVTRVAGPYYWVLQLIIPSCVLLSLGILVYCSKKGKDWYSKRRGVALLLGTSPTALSVLIIMLCMHLGYKVNATVVLSLAVNVLLGVLIYTQYEHRLFRFLSFIPSTSEFKLTSYAIKAAHRARSHNLRDAIDYFERALINDTLNKCGGNKTTTAQLLGVSRATLRRKLGDVED